MIGQLGAAAFIAAAILGTAGYIVADRRRVAWWWLQWLAVDCFALGTAAMCAVSSPSSPGFGVVTAALYWGMLRATRKAEA